MEGQLVCLACELEQAGFLAGEVSCAESGHERSLVTEEGIYHFLKSARAELLSRSQKYAGQWVDVAGALYEDGNVLHVTRFQRVHGPREGPAVTWRAQRKTVTGRAT